MSDHLSLTLSELTAVAKGISGRKERRKKPSNKRPKGESKYDEKKHSREAAGSSKGGRFAVMSLGETPVVVVTPPVEVAQFPPQKRYLNQRPNTDPWMLSVLEDAKAFWQKRGLDVSDISFDIADDLSDTDGTEGIVGRGWDRKVWGEGRIVILDSYAREQMRRARGNWTLKERRREAAMLANVIFHEVGHVGGLPHTVAAGLMDSSSSVLAWEANLAARRIAFPVPKKKKRSRRQPNVSVGSGTLRRSL